MLEIKRRIVSGWRATVARVLWPYRCISVSFALLLSVLRRHTFALYCTVVAALALTPYLLPAVSLVPLSTERPAVDGELSDVVASVYAPNGRKRYRSESARVKHLHDDVLTLEPFAMQYYSEGAPTMSLKSESGRVLQRGELVELNGAVELDRPAGGQHPHEIVSTRNVEIKTERWIAVTKEQVMLERGTQVTHGRGMVANLKSGEIELLDDVRVQHVP